MNAPESGFVEIMGAPLYYEATGAGHPLVLFHEGFADSCMFDDQVAAFAARYRVIRYDRHGSGQSGVPDRPYTDHDALRDLLRHLGIARTALLGMSAGGGVALDVSLAYPELVDALILSSASIGGYTSSEVTLRGWAAFGAALEQGDGRRAIELLRTWVDGPSRTPDAVDPAVRERMRAMMAHWLTRPRGEPRTLEPPAIGRLGEIAVPTLAIVGDGDVLDIVAQADLLRTGIAGARKAIVPGVAHIPNMERPELFNRLVLELLDARY